jgi:sugar phosphate isomerase/epimerase
MVKARIRIGNQTAKSARPLLLPYEFALANGFDAFEWYSDGGAHGWSEQQFGDAERRRLRQTSLDRDLLFSVHAPIAATPFTPDGQAAILRSMDFGGAVGAKVVNIHLVTERGAEAFATALMPLLRHARTQGVKVSLENTPQTTPEDFNAVFAHLARLPEVAGGRVGMCLDIGHANLCPTSRNDYWDFVDRLGLHVPVIHWHAHENWGDGDSHLPLFTGPSARDDTGIRGLVWRLLQRGFRGNVVLEQWPDPPELLAQARHRLRCLIAQMGGAI